MDPILTTAAGNPENQDRGLIIRGDGRVLLAVADGAGGRSGGTEAAVMAMEFLRQNAGLAITAGTCAELIQRMDAALAKDAVAGETTCAMAVVTRDQIFGASVGDSGVWLIPSTGQLVDLSHGQQIKPFVGTGCARAVPFQRSVSSGTLLLATDGLLKYTSPERIVETCRAHAIESASERLLALVRYASGTLPDDVTFILKKL